MFQCPLYLGFFFVGRSPLYLVKIVLLSMILFSASLQFLGFMYIRDMIFLLNSC